MAVQKNWWSLGERLWGAVRHRPRPNDGLDEGISFRTLTQDADLNVASILFISRIRDETAQTDPQALRDYIDEADGFIRALYDEGQLVGAAAWGRWDISSDDLGPIPEADAAKIRDDVFQSIFVLQLVAVSASATRRGLGRRLVADGELIAASRGGRMCVAVTQADSVGSEFFTKCGYLVFDSGEFLMLPFLIQSTGQHVGVPMTSGHSWARKILGRPAGE